MSVRVGQGFDLHQFVNGRPLMLGGVHVPFDRGLAGHSDGDVAAHALCDAVLGAAGFGDIGTRFPADDARWEGVTGVRLCEEVASMVRGAGWEIGNADVTVVCERPRLAPFVADMVAALAAGLGVAPGQMRIAPKSPEGLGPAGRGEGIMALAVCLLVST